MTDGRQDNSSKATDAIPAAVARLDAFVSRLQGVEALLRKDIDHPSKALWGLLSADMDEPRKMIDGVTKGLAALKALRAELVALDLHADPARANAVGKQIDLQVWSVQQSVKLTLAALQRANSGLAADEQLVADSALEADKFLYMKVPEVLGAIAVAVTKNKQAGALAEGLASVVQRGAAGVSAKLQGVSEADLDAVVGSMQKTEIDAVVKLLCSLLAPRVADTGKLSHVLATLAMNVSKEVLNAARAAQGKGLKPEELERILAAAAVKGYAATLAGMVKALPILAERDVAKKVFDALSKVAVGAAMAGIKQEDTHEAAKDAAWDVVKDEGFDQLQDHALGTVGERQSARATWLKQVLQIDLNARTLEAAAS